MEKYLKIVDTLQEEMLTLWKEWANIDSGTDNIAGLNEMRAALIQAFTKLNGDIQEIELPHRKQVDSLGQIKKYPLGHALVIQKHSHAAIQILLAGHMDIALATQGCKPLDSNMLQGPGVADMKGGLVILFYVLKMLEESPLAGKIGWTVIINPDEEIGSPGSKFLFSQYAVGQRFGLIFEPSLSDGKIVSARKGSANFTAVAHGTAAHAGRDFHAGKNALSIAARFALAAESLTNEVKQITVNIGQIEGGGPVNIVPNLGICRLNVRTRDPEDMQQIKEHLERYADELNIELIQDSARSPKPFDEATQVLFHRMRKHAGDHGFDLHWKESGGVCDGNLLAGAGLPTIDTLESLEAISTQLKSTL